MREHREGQRKAALNILDRLEMVKQCLRKRTKSQKLLRVARDKKMLRIINAYVLKGHGT